MGTELVLLMGFVVTALAGGLVFAMFSGFTTREAERAARKERVQAPEALRPEVPKSCLACGTPLTRSLDDLVAQVEKRVRLEMVAVDEFIAHPSAQSLHRKQLHAADPDPESDSN